MYGGTIRSTNAAAIRWTVFARIFEKKKHVRVTIVVTRCLNILFLSPHDFLSSRELPGETSSFCACVFFFPPYILSFAVVVVIMLYVHRRHVLDTERVRTSLEIYARIAGRNRDDATQLRDKNPTAAAAAADVSRYINS